MATHCPVLTVLTALRVLTAADGASPMGLVTLLRRTALHTYGRFGAAVGTPPVCVWECLIARTPLGMCRGYGAHPFEEQHIRNIRRLLCARRAPRRGGAQTDSLALCAQLCRRMRSADAFTLALYSTAVAALTRSSQSANSERTALSCAQQWRSAGPNAVRHRGSAPSQPQCRLVRLLDMTALHRRRGLKPKEASCV